MIRLRLSQGDLERMRFAYSPLAEVAESLYVLRCGQIPALHRVWFEKTRKRLRRVDMEVLRAIVPAPRPHVASFLLAGAREPSTSIEAQLDLVAACPVDRLRADLETVWRGVLPPVTRRILEHGGGQRIADALWQYWLVAVRSAPGARTGRARHPRPEQREGVRIRPRRRRAAARPMRVRLAARDGRPGRRQRAEHHLRPPRDRGPVPNAELHARHRRTRRAARAQPGGDPDRVALPKSTSDLARELDQSMPAVSAHLAVLRRSGLVMSWRAGRRVLYQRTPLATSVIAASGGASPGPETLHLA